MTDTSKATPRPWRTHGRLVSYMNGLAIDAGPDSPSALTRVATVYRTVPGLHGPDEATCEANAALIVQAVNAFDELLEAARAFVEHVRTDYLHDGPGCSGMCEKAGALYKALAAAEGKGE